MFSRDDLNSMAIVALLLLVAVPAVALKRTRRRNLRLNEPTAHAGSDGCDPRADPSALPNRALP